MSVRKMDRVMMSRIRYMMLEDHKVYLLIRFGVNILTYQDTRVIGSYQSKAQCEALRNILNSEAKTLSLEYTYACVTQKVQ